MVDRSISFLQDKYDTKQPGECYVSSRLQVEYGNKAWRMAAKIRVCKYVMNELRIQGFNRDMCINLVKKINLKELHRTLSCEAIITCICFYVKKLEKPEVTLEDYSVCSEYNVTDKNFELVMVRLANHFQKNSYLFSNK